MQIFAYTPENYFGSNTYILNSDGEGAVIDPSIDYFDVRDMLIREGIKIKYILITHAHFDHFLKIESWVDATHAKVVVGEADAPALADSKLNCYWQFMRFDYGYKGEYTSVRDGDVIRFGNAELVAIETPGHSRGSISYLGEGALFSGDVLFAGGGFGRVDLPGGDFRILMQSIKRLLTYPDCTKVYCGHGEETTILQLKTNFR